MFNREKKDIGNYQLSSAFNKRVDSQIIDEREQDMSVDIHLPVAKFGDNDSYVDLQITRNTNVYFKFEAYITITQGQGAVLPVMYCGSQGLYIEDASDTITLRQATDGIKTQSQPIERFKGQFVKFELLADGTTTLTVEATTTNKSDWNGFAGWYGMKLGGANSISSFNGRIRDCKMTYDTTQYHLPLCSTPLGWDAVNNTIHPVNNVELEYVKTGSTLMLDNGAVKEGDTYYPNPTLDTNPRHPAPTTGVYAYNDDESNVQIHGRLYDYPSAKYMQPLSQGWKMASDDEFKQLELHIGMTQAEVDATGWRGTVANKLKAVGFGNGTDDFGFGANGGGERYSNGLYTELTTGSDFWAVGAYRRYLGVSQVGIYNSIRDIQHSYSVRYIQAAPATEPHGTTGTVTFYGKSYNWVVIGTQKWMSENFAAKLEDKPAPELIKGSTFLNYTPARYDFNSIRNLDKKRFFDLSDSNIYNLLDVKHPNNDINNLNDYGGLYKYTDAVEIVKDISADGWRLPINTDVNTLRTHINNNTENIKAIGTTYWNAPNTNANNTTGLSIRGAGYATDLYSNLDFRLHANIWLDATMNTLVVFSNTSIFGWSNVLLHYHSVRYMRPTTQPNGTTSTVTIKGVVHNTVVIGTQEWMSESLKIDGSNMLPFPNEPLKWDNETLEKLKYVPEELLDVKYPNGDVNNLAAYGGLYTFRLGLDFAEAHASGWRIATGIDRVALRNAVGANDVGGKLKEAGFIYWDSPNTGANNSSGFNGRGAGYWHHGAKGFKTLCLITVSFTSGVWSKDDASYFLLASHSDGDSASQENNKPNMYQTIRYMRDTTQPHGTTSTVEINGTTYNTIVIGTQEWMSESLRETKIDEVLNPFIKSPFQQIIKLCILDNYEDKLKLDREYNDA